MQSPYDYISTKEASEYTGYHPDYLSGLCRSGKIQGLKVGKVWLVNKNSLNEFLGVSNEVKKVEPAKDSSERDHADGLEMRRFRTAVNEKVKYQDGLILSLQNKISELEKSTVAQKAKEERKEVKPTKFSHLLVSDNYATAINKAHANQTHFKIGSYFPKKKNSFISKIALPIISLFALSVLSIIFLVVGDMNTELIGNSVLPTRVTKVVNNFIQYDSNTGNENGNLEIDWNRVLGITKNEGQEKINNSEGKVLGQSVAVTYNKPIQVSEDYLKTFIDDYVKVLFDNGVLPDPLEKKISFGGSNVSGNSTSANQTPASLQTAIPSGVPTNNLVPVYIPVGVAPANPATGSNGSSLFSATNISADRFVGKSLEVSESATLKNLTVTGSVSGNISGTLNPGFTTGAVAFQGASGLSQDAANLFWDDTNNVLGLGTGTPSVSALLDITSTSRGVLMPRMTAAQRDLISTPTVGLTIFNTDSNRYNFYDGSSWVVIAAGALSASLSSVTAASTDSTIANSANNIVWNWALTGAESGMVFGESAASTGGSNNQQILKVGTLATSTAMPLFVENLGAGRSFQVSDETADTSPFVIDAGGNVGIGTTSPTTKLQVIASNAGGSGSNGSYLASTTTGALNNNFSAVGSNSEAYLNTASNSGTNTSLVGSIALADSLGTGSITNIFGSQSIGYLDGAGTVTNLAGLDATAGSYAGTVTNVTGGRFQASRVGGTVTNLTGVDILSSTGAATNVYGLKVGDLTTGTNNYGISLNQTAGANNYAIYSSGTAKSYFAGNVGIGTTAPNYPLEVNGAIRAGTTGSYGTRIFGDSSGGLIAFGTIASPTSLGQMGPYSGLFNIDSGNNSISFKFSGTERARIDSLTGNLGIGTTAPDGRLEIAGNLSASAWGLNGIQLQGTAATYTDTSSSGTVTNAVANSFAQPTFAASSATTYTNAASLYIANAPAAGTNVSLTNPYALWVDDGNVRFDGNLSVSGSVTGAIDPAFTTGSVVFQGASGLAQDNTNFFWNDSTNRLGLGNASPLALLHIGSGTDTPTGGPVAYVSGTGNIALSVRDSTSDAEAQLFAGSGITSIGSVTNTNFYLRANNNIAAYVTGNLNPIFNTTNTAALGIGGGPLGSFDINRNITGTPSSTYGPYMSLTLGTFTDSTTASSGTASAMVFNSIAQPTLAATNSSVTTTNAYGLYLAGAPIKGTNQSITNTTAMNIAAGAVGTVTNSYGLQVNAQTGGTNNYSAIFNGGNVGIGTSSPSSLLELRGTSPTLTLNNVGSSGTITNSSGAINITPPTGGNGIQVFSSLGKIFQITEGAHVVIGTGENSATPVGYILRAPSASAVADTAGGNLTIQGGTSTGSANGGSIIFRVANQGSSGTSFNTIATAFTISPPATGTTALVNGITLTGAITGSSPVFSATGSDSSIGIKLTPKGTGNVSITGSTGTANGVTALSVTDASTGTFRLSFTNSGAIQFSSHGVSSGQSLVFGGKDGDTSAFTELFRIDNTNGRSYFSNGNVGIGTASPDGRLEIAGNLTQSAWGVNGIALQGTSATYTDSSTAGSGTATNAVFNSFGRPILAATNTSVTTTNAATVYIENSPLAGTNQTITNPYALWVDDGNVRFDGNLVVNGTLTGSGSGAFGYWTRSGTTISPTTSGDALSVPGGGTASEKFGNGSSAGGGYATAVGNSAVASQNYATALGANSTASGQGSLALGHYASALHDSSVVLGFNSASTTASQFVVGSGNAPITNLYFGYGVTNATPIVYTINGTGGSGTDIVGGDLQFAGGRATGNAAGGDILFQTSDAGASSATLQTLTTKMTLTELGNLGIGTTVPGSKLHVVANSLGSTSTDGFVLENQTAATSGQQQWSPRIRLTGQGWRTVATASSKTLDWIMENQTTSASNSGIGSLVWSYQTSNVPGYNQKLAIIPSDTDGTGTMVAIDGTSPSIRIKSTSETNGLIIGATAGGARYIQSYESQPLNINTSGNNVIFNTSGGSVGIGTSTVSAKLHVLTTSEQLRLGYDASNYSSFTVGSTGALTLAQTGTGGAISLTSSRASGGTTSSAFNIKTSTDLGAADELVQMGDSAADFFTLYGNGQILLGAVNVGSGNTGVSVNTNFNSVFGINNTDNVANAGNRNTIAGFGNTFSGNTGTNNNSVFGSQNVVSASVLHAQGTVVGYGNTLSAATNGNIFGNGITNGTDNSVMIGPSNTAKLTILSSGNLGVGDANPGEKLVVASGNARLSKTYGLQWNDGNDEIRVEDTPSWLSTKSNVMTFETYDGAWVYRNTDASNIAMTIVGSSGYVGIGTTAPSESLHVSGGNILIGKRGDSTIDWAKVSQSTAGTIAASGTANIDGAWSAAVFNGSLYVGTYETAGSEVYRYDGGTTWTKVSQSTAGTIASAGTASIDSISSMVVYNGSLYVGTEKTGEAEVYRYDGGTTWTKVSQSTAGTIAASGTTAIDLVSTMAVVNGILYAGTFKSNSAEVYRYDGGTTWTKVSQTTAGTIASGGTANIDNIASMVSYNGNLYVGTEEGTSAEIYRYDGGTTWTKVSAATAGTINTGGTASVAAVYGMTVYNGSLIAGTYKSNAAEIYRYDGSAGNWTKISQSSAGTIASGGTANIDAIWSFSIYNGSLYAGTQESASAEIYRYDGGTTWTKVSQSTAGTIVASGTSSIVSVFFMIPYNNDLYAGTQKSDAGEVLKYITNEGQSYALKFNAASDNANAEQNGLLNIGQISFAGEQNVGGHAGQVNTGTFLFSHAITTSFGGYDLAEDYPTRDTDLSAGDVVMTDIEDSLVTKATGSYNSKIVGVYSSQPALRLSQRGQSIDGLPVVPVALVGRVPVKVTNENGPVKPGDFLTVSATKPGYAMKATRSGQVIGKALASFGVVTNLRAQEEVVAEEITGEVLMYVDPGFQMIGNTFVMEAEETTQLLGQENGGVKNTGVAAMLIDQKGSGNILQLQQNGVDRFILDNAGNLAIQANNKCEAVKRNEVFAPRGVSEEIPCADLLRVVNQEKIAFRITPFGDVQFGGRVLVSKDTAGSAKINAGDSEVRINFENPYPFPPRVVITVQGVPNFFYGVVNKDGTGFSIKTSMPVEVVTEFDWIALAQPDDVQSVSSKTLNEKIDVPNSGPVESMNEGVNSSSNEPVELKNPENIIQEELKRPEESNANGEVVVDTDNKTN